MYYYYRRIHLHFHFSANTCTAGRKGVCRCSFLLPSTVEYLEYIEFAACVTVKHTIVWKTNKSKIERFICVSTSMKIIWNGSIAASHAPFLWANYFASFIPSWVWIHIQLLATLSICPRVRKKEKNNNKNVKRKKSEREQIKWNGMRTYIFHGI